MMYRPQRGRRGVPPPRARTLTGETAQSPYVAGGGLQQENKQFGGKTFVVPLLPSIDASASIKASVLRTTVSSARNVSHDDWNIKTHFLQTRFGLPSLEQTAKTKTQNLERYESPCFTYEYIRTLDVQGTAIVLPNQANLTVAYRQHARYIELQVTCNPQVAFPECPTLPEQETQTALLVLPRANGNLPDPVTRAMINQPMQLITYLATNQLTISFVNRRRDGTNSTEPFRKWMLSIQDRSRFEVSAHLLQTLYVGTGVISTPATRLRSNLQSQRDPSSGEMVHRSVLGHFQSQNTILAEMDAMPFEINICEVFYSTLDEPIRKGLENAGYTVPTSDGVTNDRQMTNLQNLRDEAVREEKKILQISSIAQATQLSSSRRSGAAAFLSPAGSWLDDDAFEPMLQLPPKPVDFPQPPAPLPEYSSFLAQGLPIPEFGYEDSVECVVLLASFISTAEEAMAEASGTRSPMICWGCEQPGHRFNDCPRKEDADVQLHARAKINEWRKKYIGRGYRNPEAYIPRSRIEADWRKLGFASLAQAKDILFIMSTATSAGARKDKLASLFSSFTNKRALAATPETASILKSPRLTQPKDDSGYFVIYGVPQTGTAPVALLAPPQEPLKTYPLSMTQTLPKMFLPIGNLEDNNRLLGIVDTAAGACLGNLQYHEAAAKMLPGIITNFVKFEESLYREEHIGGIDGGPASVTITASCDYILPYQVKGVRASLRLALAPHIATNTIFGITFLRQCKFVIDLEGDAMHSSVFGASYELLYQAPLLDTAPPLQEITQGVSMMGTNGQQE